MTCVSAFVAVAAIDSVWQGRHEADLRRRWFSFDMIRTWWETNQWKREGRRKRRKL